MVDYHCGRPDRHRYTLNDLPPGSMCSWPLLEAPDAVCGVHSAVEPTGSSRVLEEAGFDGFVEAQCALFFADGVGRPSLAPGRYFPLLLLGYFEGQAGLGTGDCVAAVRHPHADTRRAGPLGREAAEEGVQR